MILLADLERLGLGLFKARYLFGVGRKGPQRKAIQSLGLPIYDI